MIKKKTTSIVILSLLIGTSLFAQRWQQKVEYEMQIDFSVEKHQFDGKQKLKYYNNSPDTLKRVFYHLFFNAFQPGSMMDVRSRTIKDPDKRVGKRIAMLKPEEIGYQKIKSLTQDGKPVSYEVVGTILEVALPKPILPKSEVLFEMEFEAQVPVQIRRSGRDNKEGISYTMTQWYPKMCEYDEEGWHSNPYIGREFHGIWGDFDVKINIDANYTIGGTGYLQNKKAVGHGYDEKQKTKKKKKGKLQWHFNAPMVHDFAWAADPDYKHDILTLSDNLDVHLFYQSDADTLQENWNKLKEYLPKVFEIANKKFGKYPYNQYSIIQGGDGGMEYAMCTMITGKRQFKSLLGVVVHELMHSWYQHVLGFNEAKYAWMDEGFTSYAEEMIINEVLEENKLNPFAKSYKANQKLYESGKSEILNTHSDFYKENKTYGINAYARGAIFLNQLEYIIGEEPFSKGLLRLFEEWKFRHPNPNDVIRVFEKESGLELTWYLEQWTNSLNVIDYSLRTISPDESNTNTVVILERIGDMPMPLEVVVTSRGNEKTKYYIPLEIMRGEKEGSHELQKDWPWVYPYYPLIINQKISAIKKIEIDPSMKMADINRENNIYPFIKPEVTLKKN